MKCEFCTWIERPESLVHLKRHLVGNHWGLKNYYVVWRQGELVLAAEELGGDIDINFKKPEFVDPPTPEVVNFVSGKPNTTMGSLPTESGPVINSTVPQGMPLSRDGDLGPLIDPQPVQLVPEELLRSQGNDVGKRKAPRN